MISIEKYKLLRDKDSINKYRVKSEERGYSSRHIYPTLDQVIVEDCFRQTIQKYGVPEAVYFDNGKQYRTKWMGRTCAKAVLHMA